MKIKKIFDLIDKGLTAKTLSKLSESQIEVLHSRIIGESRKEAKEEIKKTVTNVTYDPANEADKQKLAQMGVHVGADKKITMSQAGGAITTETEMSEEDDFDMDADQAYTGQQGSHDEYQAADDGMDDDTSPENKDRKMVGVTESKKKEQNPWAICTAQLGKEFGTTERTMWNAKEKNKYERCVKDVKKSLKEGKNPVSLFIENEIMRIVEKNMPPKITKGDLLKYLNENEPAVAPKPGTKPKESPTKPGTKPRPKHPGKNPNPGEKPAPKATKTNVSPEKAKDDVIDMIMKMLKK